MENFNQSLSQAYHQALVNPQGLSVDDFAMLIAKYPYSQPLHFAFDRMRFFKGELDVLTGMSILMARNPSWLYEYVQLAPQEVPAVEVVDNDYVPFEEFEDEVDDSAMEASTDNELAELVLSTEEIVLDDLPTNEALSTTAESLAESDLSTAEVLAPLSSDAELLEEAEQTALNTLVQEGIGGGDYFALHAKAERLAAEQANQADAIELKDTIEPPVEELVVGSNQEADNISLYNDDMMPYSFRWWLHKTRQEHAGTYQPFAFQPRATAAAAESMQFDPVKLDKHVLDQQIRQNIIHFQNPEDKLSDAIKQREVKVVEESKTAAVIERFIREEPQIQPPSADHLNNENKARKSSEEQFDLVTETLANIYVNQAMHVKAIEVYKKLILKNPEKKSYFADRIKELEEKLY